MLKFPLFFVVSWGLGGDRKKRYIKKRILITRFVFFVKFVCEFAFVIKTACPTFAVGLFFIIFLAVMFFCVIISC